MGKIIGLVRVSTQRQSSEGLSLPAQIERLKAYAAFKGWPAEDLEIVEERAVSGKAKRRPVIDAIKKRAKAGELSAVVVCRLDRAGRSTLELLDFIRTLKDSKVAFHALDVGISTDTTMGEFLTVILSAVASLESSNIAERTRFALSHARREGKVYGRIPFGYRVEGKDKDRRLVPDARAMKGVTRAQAMRAEGRTLQEIGDWLTSNGYKPPQGGSWAPGSVKAMLESKKHLEEVA